MLLALNNWAHVFIILGVKHSLGMFRFHVSKIYFPCFFNIFYPTLLNLQKYSSGLNPSPAEPRYILYLQTVQKPTDLDLHHFSLVHEFISTIWIN